MEKFVNAFTQWWFKGEKVGHILIVVGRIIYRNVQVWRKEVCTIVYYSGTNQQLRIKLDKKYLGSKKIGPKLAQHVGNTSQVPQDLW